MANLYRRSLPALIFSAVILCALVALSSCDSRMREAGPSQTTNIALNKDAVNHANVELDMKAGELRVNGGTDRLIHGTFEFNVDSYKPKVRSDIDGSHAAITIEQPKDIEFNHNGRNIWDLQLNDSVLLDLSFHCGAGKVDMNLGSLNLRSLQVHMGAGQVDIDLGGHPKHDYEVEVAGGVGQATIHLPQGVGIRADVHGGIGHIDVNGLAKRGDHYENDSFETAKVNVRLKVTGGIGEIRIVD